MSHGTPPIDREAEFVSASKVSRTTLLSEVMGFLAVNKKWWLLPIMVMLLFFGLILILGGSALAPFIYPLF